MTQIDIENVSLSINGVTLVDHVSAQLQTGKFTVLLGPNGAGKSLLLGCLAGLKPRQTGSITMANKEINSLPPKERAKIIGLLPQAREVNWNITVETLVSFGRLAHHGAFSGTTDSDETAIKNAITATGIAPFLTRTVKTLSGGELARVLLARVLAGEPDWLLADEPLANLDPVHQMDVLDLLAAIALNGRGVVAVLHDLTQAARFGDHIILMAKGRVIAAGKPDDVLVPKHIRAAYGIDADIIAGADGRPVITPVRWHNPNHIEGAA
jgi:iron complex transport system ATP-binding protein